MQAQGETTQVDQQSNGHPSQDPFLNALRRQRVPVAIYLDQTSCDSSTTRCMHAAFLLCGSLCSNEL